MVHEQGAEAPHTALLKVCLIWAGLTQGCWARAVSAAQVSASGSSASRRLSSKVALVHLWCVPDCQRLVHRT